MKASRMTSIFYIFLGACLISCNALQAERVFRPDDWDQRPHRQDRRWANNRWGYNRSNLSPELISLYIHLRHPEISNSQYAGLRKNLLYRLNNNEFIKVYNELPIIRDWPESNELIVQTFKDNDYKCVKTLITELDTEHFIRWYPYVSYHYEAYQRINQCYRWMNSSDFNKNSPAGRTLSANAQRIKKEVTNAPKLQYLTPVKNSVYRKCKDYFGYGTNRRHSITQKASTYITQNYSNRVYNRVTAKFETIEQRSLQGRVINVFNQIGDIERYAPVKKQDFLKEASNFGIIASENNHLGLIELGNQAVAVCENLVEFALGVGEGVWSGSTYLASAVYNYDQTYQSLVKAAQWCNKLFTGSFCVIERTQNALDNFDINDVGPAIKDVMQGAVDIFQQASARERGRAVGEALTLFYSPKAILSGSTQLISKSLKTIKNLDIGNKAWKFVSVQEKLVLATEFGPMTTFAAETVNFMSATQKAASGATLKAAQNIRKIAGLSVSLSPDFILKRIKFLANDNNKLAQFVKTTGETLGKNDLPSSHGFEKYFAELKNLGIAESKIQEIAQHAYNAAVKEKKLHATFSELGTMVQCAKGIMKEIAQLYPNKISHIMAEKHAWSKVVKDASNWDEIAKIMSKVMEKGVKESHTFGLKKILEYKKQIIEVTYIKENKIVKISNAWVKTI